MHTHSTQQNLKHIKSVYCERWWIALILKVFFKSLEKKLEEPTAIS